ncbi:hypothetical protein BRADI_1g38928v3 [Brachypodium distachyon]|uniref:Uncharacterized protein n=1 Tax=Brachypodium distachyon TaxID=15368 RepID=A0A0Q3H6G2_BRADI|nr:hypothetical protein BRADI_1g38928v3 [Brachypodium distachyon]
MPKRSMIRSIAWPSPPTASSSLACTGTQENNPPSRTIDSSRIVCQPPPCSRASPSALVSASPCRRLPVVALLLQCAASPATTPSQAPTVDRCAPAAEPLSYPATRPPLLPVSLLQRTLLPLPFLPSPAAGPNPLWSISSPAAPSSAAAAAL